MTALNIDHHALPETESLRIFLISLQQKAKENERFEC